MNTIRMKYKDYEFPSNPKAVEITSGRRLAVHSAERRSIAQSRAPLPVTVRGRGSFSGADSEEICAFISNMLRDGTAGWLFCPGLCPMKAFFTEFSYRLSADKARTEYSFVFTEESDASSYEAEVDYLTAAEGENAFMLANRAGISVSELMRLNAFPSPFEISAGERVWIK